LFEALPLPPAAFLTPKKACSKKDACLPAGRPCGNLFTLRSVSCRGDGETCPAGNNHLSISGLRTVTAPYPSASVAELRFPKGVLKTASISILRVLYKSGYHSGSSGIFLIYSIND